jgi:hypothetical protein
MLRGGQKIIKPEEDKMKTITLINKAIVISALTALCCIASFAQFSTQGVEPTGDDTIGRELRPFDFTDKYYSTHGVETAFIINRRNGSDGESVIDFAGDEIYSSVRILATRPAYAYDGSPIYWNLYGEFFKEAFKPGPEGEQARTLAESFPIYIFPSATAKNQERQAAVIENIEGYFDKNVLGLGIVKVVQYTGTGTREDKVFLQEIANRNGLSLDGTPIIRTKSEIHALLRRNLITVKVRGTDSDPGRAPFAVAKIIQYPDSGAIAPDAFLMHARQRNGEPLPSERFFVADFECFKSGGRCSIIR